MVNQIQLSYKKVDVPNAQITNSHDAYNLIKKLWEQNLIEIQEHFMVIYLNRQNKVIGYFTPFKGGNASTVVDDRIIFATGLKAIASAIIVAHNHPSGSLKPSEEDIKLTKKLVDIGKQMSIKCVDSMIITKDNGYFSMSDEGMI